MIHLEDRKELYERVLQTISADMGLLDELREDVANLSAHMRRIQPRSTTAMSLVGTDGGNNQLHFDPLSVRSIVRSSTRRELRRPLLESSCSCSASGVFGSFRT